MKTYKETFDEGIWDRAKAKASGAVAGAKGWAGQTGRNVMGTDPGDARQVGADAKLQAQADSLSKGGAGKLQKLIADVEKDLVELSGVKDINEFTQANPKVKELLDNIDANIDVLAAGQVQLDAPAAAEEPAPEEDPAAAEEPAPGEEPAPADTPPAAEPGAKPPVIEPRAEPGAKPPVIEPGAPAAAEPAARKRDKYGRYVKPGAQKRDKRGRYVSQAAPKRGKGGRFVKQGQKRDTRGRYMKNKSGRGITSHRTPSFNQLVGRYL